MRVRWFGQSAYLFTDGDTTVFIDPFGEVDPSRGMKFDYPQIAGVDADVLLITHEHFDHSNAEAIGGSPHTIRSTAGTFGETPIGEVVAVAGEHDDKAGTERGPTSIFRFSLNGLTLCHPGDFGQSALRPEQKAAIGEIDVLFVPVGGGFTIGGKQAAELAAELSPRLIIPMHYRTPAIGFLEGPEEFLDNVNGRVEQAGATEVELDDLLGSREEPVVTVLDAPGA
jgi:L-ascorbate metabolism protein UlaG (beta-lactamase superfamily)